jgi:hypothetical protein
MLCYAMLCLLCYAMLCYAMLCHARLVLPVTGSQSQAPVCGTAPLTPPVVKFIKLFRLVIYKDFIRSVACTINIF